VHGFDNSESDVIVDNIPTYFKRLYWVQHPVLPAQQGMYVGLSWPSNPGGTQFPVAEFLGLETGAPLACLLQDLKGPGQQLNIVAHSLGNMAVNSALQRVPAGVVTNYVMNEAAVPAEAFHDPNTAFLPSEIYDGYVFRVQQSYGYPDDKPWQDQWNDMVAGKPFNDNIPNPIDFLQWQANILNLPVPQPQYFARWTQQRPASGVPDFSTDITPHRGPWKGYFFGNREKVSGRLVNTWSTVDNVLGGTPGVLAWWTLMEATQKPFIGILGLGSGADTANERETQFWAQLGMQSASEEALWSGGCDAPQPNHYNTVRQWEELAMWFGSLSDAAGHQPMSTVLNNDFTTFSASPDRSTTHSYMTAKPFYEVYNAFKTVRDSLK
jgi:hypothetical protein